MKLLLFFYCLLFMSSCVRYERLEMKGNDRYVFTDEYTYDDPDDLREPPYLIRNGQIWLSEVYHITWNDYAIIATRYPKKSSFHEYYVIYGRDSMLNGYTDSLIGPFTITQRDSVIAAHRIDTASMKEIDFN